MSESTFLFLKAGAEVMSSVRPDLWSTYGATETLTHWVEYVGSLAKDGVGIFGPVGTGGFLLYAIRTESDIEYSLVQSVVDHTYWPDSKEDCVFAWDSTGGREVSEKTLAEINALDR